MAGAKTDVVSGKMLDIFGRSTAPPRKHNRFVPDGYVPPKSRQKIVSPPQRTTTTGLRTTGTRDSGLKTRRIPSPRDASPENQNVRPKSSPTPKSILKTSRVLQNHAKNARTPSPRVKSAGTSPQSPAASSCPVDGTTHHPPRPPSRPKKAMQRGYYDGKPISVVDKYDERDNPIWWKSLIPINRRGPPSKSSLRPHLQRPNILYKRVVNAQGESTCSTQSFCMEDDEEDVANCEPCCAPLDWEHDSTLKNIVDRQAYRQCKLEEYLRDICRRCDESFANYIIRCYAYANEELNSHASKHLLGYVDEHLSCLDTWVLRLHRGTLSRLLRSVE